MPGLDFSFAGLKTALLYRVRELGEAETERRRADLAASYQRAIVESLALRVERALAADRPRAARDRRRGRRQRPAARAAGIARRRAERPAARAVHRQRGDDRERGAVRRAAPVSRLPGARRVRDGRAPAGGGPMRRRRPVRPGGLLPVRRGPGGCSGGSGPGTRRVRPARARHRVRRRAPAPLPGADPGDRRSTARRRSSCSSTRRSWNCGSVLCKRDELHGYRGPGSGARGREHRRRQAGREALTRRRRAPVALPPGADPGAQDGQGDDLLTGARRLHARQLDPDPPGPVRIRKVRQARRRLQRRLAGHADPQDPAHLGSAQHRPVRRRPSRHRDRDLGHLRRPRLPGRGRVRHRRGQGRAPRSAR